MQDPFWSSVLFISELNRNCCIISPSTTKYLSDADMIIPSLFRPTDGNIFEYVVESFRVRGNFDFSILLCTLSQRFRNEASCWEGKLVAIEGYICRCHFAIHARDATCVPPRHFSPAVWWTKRRCFVLANNYSCHFSFRTYESGRLLRVERVNRLARKCKS